MDLTRPARCIAPSLHIDVLGVLAGTTMPLTGRQVQRLLGSRASLGGVQNVLTKLVTSGLVHLTEAGSSHLYVLNREHVAAEAVLALTDLRGRLFERIREAVGSWSTQPLSVTVFGSAARGDGSEESDVDLFVVRPEAVAPDDASWTRDVAELNASIRRWSGNAGSVIDVTPRQVSAMIARQEPVVAELARDQVLLLGVNALDLVAATP